jgi:hypothetical protein
MKEWFIPRLILARWIFPIYTCKNSFPSCAPPHPPTLEDRNLYSLKMHYFRKLSCKSKLFWLISSQGKKFSMTLTNFCNFFYYLPFEEALALYLKNLEFPLPKNDLYQVWLKLVRWFYRRRLFKIFSVILLFCYYLPLDKGVPLYLNKLESPPPKDDLWPSGSGEEVENVKVYRQTDWQTDNRQRAIRKAQVS